MPNHVQNILVISGHKNHVEPMLKHLEDGDKKFSFNKIVPMPEELKGSRSPTLVVTQAEYNKFHYGKNFQGEQHFLPGGPITKKMQKDWNERFGADNWYDWAINNWGTKWGSYDVDIHEPTYQSNGQMEIVIYFQTAWSSGAQTLAKLAKQYPTINFYLRYADEDCGYNTGEVWWEKGFTHESNLPNYSMKNYFACWGGEEQWGCVDGEWKYIYEED